MNQPIILKGVVAQKHLDQNNEEIVSLQTSNPMAQSVFDPNAKYEFTPYFSVSLRARDLGDPPLGATVEIKVSLS